MASLFDKPNETIYMAKNNKKSLNYTVFSTTGNFGC